MMMKKNQLLAGAVLLALTGWSGAAAADQVYTLNPVVVTAQENKLYGGTSTLPYCTSTIADADMLQCVFILAPSS